MLKKKDVTNFTDALLAWIVARFNAFNVGQPLARHYARQVALRFPNLPEGKTGFCAVEGWTKAIMNKGYTRSIMDL